MLMNRIGPARIELYVAAFHPEAPRCLMPVDGRFEEYLCENNKDPILMLETSIRARLLAAAIAALAPPGAR
jgi:hypothetical protein